MTKKKTIEDFGLELTSGQIEGMQHIHKFGRNKAVSTTFVPVCIGGVYQTPQMAAATALRVKAGGNAADTSNGNGAREITLQGLDQTGELITATLATAGESASAATSETFSRLFRCWVSASGTYATASAGSHSANIVIENSAGGTDWATIDSTNFPRGQSEIGCYSVPIGKKAYISNVVVSVDSSKVADVIFFQRQGITLSSPPYLAMRTWLDIGGLSGEEFISPKVPFGPFPGGTDIGAMARVPTTTSEVDVEFEIILVDDV